MTVYIFTAIVITTILISQQAYAKADFPGGMPITATDLTQIPVQLPIAPPKYDPENPIEHKEFARFAWRQFIYLNAPAKQNGLSGSGVSPVVRGTVSDNQGFIFSGKPNFYRSGKTSTSNLSKHVTVWESYAHRSELFPKQSTPKGDFQTLAPQYFFKNATVTTHQARFNNLDENSQIGQNKIFFPANGSTPAENPYDDHEVLFQAKVNQVEYDYIKSLKGKAPNDFNLPPNELPNFANKETIEIKAAWRELSQTMIDSGRYHTAEALYYRCHLMVGDECEQASATSGTFGLVGLHIIRKMKHYEAFIYTTFEHVDNLVKADGSSPSGLYFITNYNQLDYGDKKGDQAKPHAVINNGVNRILVPLPTEGEVKADHGYDFIPGKFTLPSEYNRGPIKVEQPPTITKAVVEVNKEVHQAMKESGKFGDSVWQYYRLKGVQPLPTNEDTGLTSPEKPLTQDYFLANNIIESSQSGLQLFKGRAPAIIDNTLANNKAPCPNAPIGSKCLLNQRELPNITNVPELSNHFVMGGCMGCHGRATYTTSNNKDKPRSIFSFLISEKNLTGQGGFNADALDESTKKMLEKSKEYMGIENN
ncbi:MULTISPECIES: hypothetical protein [Pseudoalteromonas]|nr:MULTISPECIES: hypothetical protein [Pseudoalteromonas]MCG7551764.1 hypothetical protein [Pseudoalteromonas sp. Of7M-16]